MDTPLTDATNEAPVSSADAAADAADAGTPILSAVRVASSTKDSVHVKWYPASDTHQSLKVHGYDVSYQALESTVVQYSQKLPSDKHDYNIKQLHEDTAYNVCIRVYTNVSTHAKANSEHSNCIQATTRSDSLHVALGSTLGAFLALAIILGFVFLAKWQYNRQRRRRQLKQSGGANGDALYHSRDMQDVDYDMSELSMHVNESHVKMSELDSQLDTIEDGGDDDAVTLDNIRALTGGDLSDCSEDPLSASCGGAVGGGRVSQAGASPYLLGSAEHCYQCDVEQALSDSTSPRSQRSKYSTSRAKSVESSRSMLSRQFSIDSYAAASSSSKRSSLRKQRSHDSGRRELRPQPSQDSSSSPGAYHLLTRQPSHDSGSYILCTDPGSCDLTPLAIAAPQYGQYLDDSMGNNPLLLSLASSTTTSRSLSPNFQLFCVQEAAAPNIAQPEVTPSSSERATENNAPVTLDSANVATTDIVNLATDDREIGDINFQSKEIGSTASGVTMKSDDDVTSNTIDKNGIGEDNDVVSELSVIAPPVNDGGHTNGLRPNTSCPNW